MNTPDTSSQHGGLLGPDDPPAVAFIDVEPAFPALLVCDHASAKIPGALNQLGLPPEAFERHIALDIGAAAVVETLSARLGLPAVLAGYSRLVVDCNRRLTDAGAFPATSDGQFVPGNQNLAQEDRQKRADELYWPYHHAIRDRLAALESLAPAPALIAIHSFSPILSAESRPWHFGVLWDKDPRIPEPLMKALRAMPSVNVGDNEPYSGRHPHDFTVDHHAEAEGLPYASIEIRQDLLTTAEGVDHWSAILVEALAPILRDEALYTNWSGA